MLLQYHCKLDILPAIEFHMIQIPKKIYDLLFLYYINIF